MMTDQDRGSGFPSGAGQEQEREITIQADGAELKGDLHIPSHPEGVVLFAHGSGNSRRSPRNRFVAGELGQGGMATLLLDLLTEEEEPLDERSGKLRFDIRLLSRRLLAAAHWISQQPELSPLKLGCFGASTGAAAALVAAAESREICTVVSRGGRPDLAGAALKKLRVPVLLIVDGEDRQVLELNRRAMGQMHTETGLEMVRGATHLFEEPGTLEQVAALARRWFGSRLARRESVVEPKAA